MRSPIEIAAQLWCLSRHSHKAMDSELAYDIADAIQAEREVAKVLYEALEDTLEYLESAQDNMKHYFEEECLPTVAELLEVDRGVLEAREALARCEENGL